DDQVRYVAAFFKDDLRLKRKTLRRDVGADGHSVVDPFAILPNQLISVRCQVSLGSSQECHVFQVALPAAFLQLPEGGVLEDGIAVLSRANAQKTGLIILADISGAGRYPIDKAGAGSPIY